jgi:hypothetical protein
MAFPDGIYFVQVQSGIYVATGKFVIQH